MYNVYACQYLYFSEETIGWIETVDLLSILLLVATTKLPERWKIKTKGTYHIAGNFGEVFNLAIWQIFYKITKFKTCQ